ncbi:MAG: redoxin domain-containing protein [Planctomycetota bacterium]
MFRRLPLCLLLIAFSPVIRAVPAAAETGVGTTISDFSLKDFRGKTVSFHDLKDKKGIVVAFLGCDCPLAKLYAPKLQAISKEYGPRDIAVLGINSNVQDNNTELGAFARVHGVEFPLLKDPGNVVADQFGAKRTPEFFLLDNKGVILYRGRMDDQYDIGVQKAAAMREDLVQALKETLEGKPVSVASTEPVGCLIGRVRKVNPSGEVTYSKHIAKIFNERCVECHRPGEIAPFNLTKYEEVVGWGDTIVEVTEERRMPPWHADPAYGHFRNNARLSDEELRLIREWVANGQPEGDPKDLPEPPKFVEGWTIGTPDKIVYMSDKPFKVPAEGTVEYQHITVDPGFKEDMWVRAAEARPGNRAIVHHIIVFVNPPNQTGLPFMGELIGGYAPGMPPVTGHDGMAALIPAAQSSPFKCTTRPTGPPKKT